MTLSWLRLLPGIIILALVAAVLIQRSHINSLGHKLDTERAGRLADRGSYKRAQDEAQAKNKADIERIRKQQEAITDEVSSDHARDLAELRRLRAKTPAPRSAPGGTKIPGVPEAPGGADENGLPAAPCDDLCASEIELRLMHLQNWIIEQGK